MASVRVNGKVVDMVWHAPYRIDLTGLLRLGGNDLAIEVTNLWPNRLIGDKEANTEPVAYAPQSTYKAESPLRPSRLIGPIALHFKSAEKICADASVRARLGPH